MRVVQVPSVSIAVFWSQVQVSSNVRVVAETGIYTWYQKKACLEVTHPMGEGVCADLSPRTSEIFGEAWIPSPPPPRLLSRHRTSCPTRLSSASNKKSSRLLHGGGLASPPCHFGAPPPAPPPSSHSASGASFPAAHRDHHWRRLDPPRLDPRRAAAASLPCVHRAKP